MKPAGNGVTPATAVPTLITGVTGLITVVLIFGGQALIQAGGGEPAFDVPASEVATFFANRQPTLFAIGSAMNVLAAVVFVWFLGGLRLLLKNDWRATVAMVSGALGLAPVLTGGWELAVFRLP